MVDWATGAVGSAVPVRGARALASSGAFVLAGSIALAAYASHAADAAARSDLQLAAAMAFGHGVAVAALAPVVRHRLGLLCLVVALLGALLFAGSLAGGHLLGVSTRMAPVGGSLMIGAWLVYAINVLRR